MTFVVGIDVGGTFTDVVICGQTVGTVIAKAATTPEDQSKGVMNGLQIAADKLGLSSSELLSRTERIVHGTTVATNALLERKGAKVGVLTTKGHRDVIEMREGLKPDRYNLRMVKPIPLVPRKLRIGIDERLRADGSVQLALDNRSLEQALDQLDKEGVEAVAICFLHAWSNPEHEKIAEEGAKARLKNVYVTRSSDVLPKIKEYERFTATVANAMVGPVIASYLKNLRERLAAGGYSGELYIMQSHGGVASIAETIRLAAGVVLSGPAGGVMGAVALAQNTSISNLITFDMGGTSTDIAVVRGGNAALSGNREVDEFKIALPSLDIVTLGAGGGSIAFLDRSGLLNVGPESAGAIPGPACYGRGGKVPTVTDANLLLGYLNPAGPFGPNQLLDRSAAEQAIEALGGRLNIGPIELAAGIYRLVNSRMADGVRVATVRRGIDPRLYAFLSFGGAAGVHITAIAAELGIRQIIVPLQASVFSAWGMLQTDLRVELARGISQRDNIDIAAMSAAFAEMERDGRAHLEANDADIISRRFAEMRYGEQIFEIVVPLDDVDLASKGLQCELERRFHQAHETLYTYSLLDESVVVVSARLSLAKPFKPAPLNHAEGGDRAVPPTTRRVYLNGWVDVPVYNLDRMVIEQSIAGPALIDSETTTILLRDREHARLEAGGWLDIRLQ